MTAETILALLLAFPTYHRDRLEEPEARRERLEPVALAIWAAADDDATQAGLVAIAWHESRLAAYVTEGRCQDGPRGACDHGQARGPFQVWGWCKATNIQGEAECAAGLLTFMRARCDSWAAAFGGYGTGGKCLPMPDRERTRQEALARAARLTAS